jgi:hypothetical protein
MTEMTIGATANRSAQIRLIRSDGFTAAKREVFLVALAMSCNVMAAAARANIGCSTAYRLRKQDARFAEQWREALNAGYDRLEAALLRRALTVIEGSLPEAMDGDDAAATLTDAVIDAVGSREPLAEMSVAQAIDIMTRLRPQAAAKSQPGKSVAAARVRPTPEQTNAEIMRRIAIVRRQSAAAQRAGPGDAA